MGLIRAVLKDVDGRSLAGIPLLLESEQSAERIGPILSDADGVARFKVNMGRYRVAATGLPVGRRLPQYPSVLKLYPNTEAAEFVIQLEKDRARNVTDSSADEAPGKPNAALPAY